MTGATAADHIAVARVVNQVARALDRRDKALLKSCFWPDATDDHGVFAGNATDFADWVMGREPEPYLRTHHNITNLIIDFNDDRAVSEAYFIAYHKMAPTGDDVFVAGRYFDRHMRRDGAWRILHRHAVYEWRTVNEATDQAWDTAPLVDQLVRGERGRGDPSYADLAWLDQRL